MPYGVPQCSGNQMPSKPSGSARSQRASAPSTHCQSGVSGLLLKLPARTRSQSCEFWAPVPRLTFTIAPSFVRFVRGNVRLASASAHKSREFLGRAYAHVLRQLVVQVDGAALPVRIGLGAWEAERLHALLHGRHVGEVLRQYGQPVRIADRGVDPLRLRLLAFRIELEHRDLEDALVGVVARVG